MEFERESVIRSTDEENEEEKDIVGK